MVRTRPNRTTIRLLEECDLTGAIRLTRAIFSEEADLPEESLRSIFEPHLHPSDFKHGIVDRVCWIWRLPVTGGKPAEITGIVGLYRLLEDPDLLYLGWFGVAGLHRGAGIGRRLLDHAIGEARRAGISHLRLETTTDPAYGSANRLYQKCGFVVFHTDARQATQRYPTVWQELKLN